MPATEAAADMSFDTQGSRSLCFGSRHILGTSSPDRTRGGGSNPRRSPPGPRVGFTSTQNDQQHRNRNPHHQSVSFPKILGPQRWSSRDQRLRSASRHPRPRGRTGLGCRRRLCRPTAGTVYAGPPRTARGGRAGRGSDMIRPGMDSGGAAPQTDRPASQAMSCGHSPRVRVGLLGPRRLCVLSEEVL